MQESRKHLRQWFIVDGVKLFDERVHAGCDARVTQKGQACSARGRGKLEAELHNVWTEHRAIEECAGRAVRRQALDEDARAAVVHQATRACTASLL